MLGLINTKQNDIFTVLTVVSVVGIPPTLVASIYGMNFKNMPELGWAYGYQWGLALIALSTVCRSCGSSGAAGSRGARRSDLWWLDRPRCSWAVVRRAAGYRDGQTLGCILARLPSPYAATCPPARAASQRAAGENNENRLST